MREFVIFVAIFIFIVIGLCVPVLYAANAFSQAQCNAATSQMKLKHKYSMLSGCLVETQKDGWLPLDNYRSF